MKYPLKDYQRTAVDKLKSRLSLLLDENSSDTIVFKAPTGSGKTFMASALFEEIAAENDTRQFCVIWACPGKGELHKQSFNAAKEYLGGNPICSLLEDDFFGTRKDIHDKEIVFVNWEKLVDKDRTTGKWKNNLMKDQEGLNFINVLENTRKEGTSIILLIDESHIGANANARIREFKETIISPLVTIEMSATPLSNPNVTIDPQDVIDEGMIKGDVIVNEGISKEDRSLEDKDSELIVLEKAFDKRNELKQAYKKIGSIVNPLVLIQIPNTEAGEDKKRVVTDFLNQRGITEENGKLKFWCDDKGNFDKKAIRKLDDVTEYLVFKTAVATGWDCPRAQILVKFRDGKSETFEIQTIGRILRTAEAKSYGDELLDSAYIFTNIKDFETRHDTYSPNRIKTETSYFRKPFTKLMVWEQTKLQSFYRSRQGDYNSADSRFAAIYEKSFMTFFNFQENEKYGFYTQNAEKFESKGFNLDINTEDLLIQETDISSKTIDGEQKVSNDTVTVKMSETDVIAQYYALIKQNLNGLAFVRSKSPINSAVIDVFSKFYNAFERSIKVAAIQRIMVNNATIFSEILSKATEEFRGLLENEKGKKYEYYAFKIDDRRSYSLETHESITAPKSLYQPLFVAKDTTSGHINQLEADFLKYLDNSNAVDWYWENGPELMKINFGISYNGNMNTFQPDFIVRFKNGTVGIFDTKGIGQRVDDTKVKSEALHRYLVDINTNRECAHKVIGGIVIKSGTQFYVYDDSVYHDYGESRDGWKNFNELLRNVETDVNTAEHLQKLVKKTGNN